MRRRHFLAAGGATFLAACAPLLRRSPFTLPPIDVAEDRILRVQVGLRPYRPQGFVVARQEGLLKTLVHNYGHGGAGVTLSWGSSLQAVESGFDPALRRYAVAGCGVMGLTTATLLQQRGASVTIYAKSLPPHTTSNIAGGHWSPYSVFESHSASPAFMAQYWRAVRDSYRLFEAMVGPRYGIHWRRNFAVNEGPGLNQRQERMREFLPDLANLPPGEHPFGDAWVVTFRSMLIEPNIFLGRLMEDFLANGGRIETRDFSHRDELASLPEDVIFNCTGLGAKALFDDPDLVPARGQLVHLRPQPEVDYNLFGDRAYLFPRSDAIVIGGTFDTGQWDLQPDVQTTAMILGNASRVTRRLR